MSRSFVRAAAPTSIAGSLMENIRVCRNDGLKSVLVYEGPRWKCEMYCTTMNYRVVSEFDEVWYVEARE
jgi:hypothetical protein